MAIQAQYPDLIRGYDLVGEEDQGHTLLFHSQSLIQGFNFSQSGSNHTFNYYFHAAETSWPNDVFPSEFGDDSSTLDNTYDAIVFQTHRIGHGLGFFKHPKLYPYLKERSIAFEICPASNQILGIGFYLFLFNFLRFKIFLHF
jgi:adenosine deaminase CECR1